MVIAKVLLPEPLSVSARLILSYSETLKRCLILAQFLLCGSFKLPASIDRQLFVMESVIAKVLLPEPLSVSARLILSYSETLKRCLILAQFLLVSDLDIQVESPVSVSRQFPSFVKTSTVKMSYSTRGRAKKPSLTLNLGTNGLKVTYEPPPIVGQAGCLQGLDLSAVTHPSSSHARRCLIQLSWDNRCTRYAAPLTVVWIHDCEISLF
ncbi:hypothetical protein J6590_044845 [Homalodisca vitripennis]|nr:hypothetical protein J6590_044845 [Homalodisca vitripennis]